MRMYMRIESESPLPSHLQVLSPFSVKGLVFCALRGSAASQPSVCPSGTSGPGRPRAKARPTKKLCRSKCHTVNIFSSARVLARYGSQTAKQCFCAKGHSPGWAGMDLSRGIKPRQ